MEVASQQPESDAGRTYGISAVHAAFRDLVGPQELQNLDRKALLSPSFFQGKHGGPLIPATTVLEARRSRSPSRSDPLRRYTYADILWIRLYAHLKQRLRPHGPRRARRRAEEVVSALRRESPDGSAPTGRLFFLGDDVFRVRESGEIDCVTSPGQGVLPQIVAGELCADVQGRLLVLDLRDDAEAAGA